MIEVQVINVDQGCMFSGNFARNVLILGNFVLNKWIGKYTFQDIFNHHRKCWPKWHVSLIDKNMKWHAEPQFIYFKISAEY